MASEGFEEAAKRLDIRAMLVSSIITALALVVGLSWNDAVKETIAQVVPKGESLYYRYLAALIITVTAVVISYFLYRSQQVKIRDLKNLAERGRTESFAAYQKVFRKIDVMHIARREKEKLKRALIKEGA